MAISLKRRRILTLFFILLFLILAPVMIFYAKGDILDKSFNFLKTGGIFLNGLENGSVVFLNNKQKEVINFFQRDLFIKSLRPNIYNIKVVKEGLNDWNCQVVVRPNLVADFKILALPQKVVLEEIPKTIEVLLSDFSTTTETSSDYSDILKFFNPIKATTTIKAKTATTTYPLGSKNSPKIKKKIGAWFSGNELYLSWLGNIESPPKLFCEEEKCVRDIKVFYFSSKIKNTDFFFGDEEVLAVLTDNNIFAIETQNNPLKKPQLIYEGKAPEFVFVDESIMYIKDGNKLFKYTI